MSAIFTSKEQLRLPIAWAAFPIVDIYSKLLRGFVSRKLWNIDKMDPLSINCENSSPDAIELTLEFPTPPHPIVFLERGKSFLLKDLFESLVAHLDMV